MKSDPSSVSEKSSSSLAALPYVWSIHCFISAYNGQRVLLASSWYSCKSWKPRKLCTHAKSPLDTSSSCDLRVTNPSCFAWIGSLDVFSTVGICRLDVSVLECEEAVHLQLLRHFHPAASLHLPSWKKDQVGRPLCKVIKNMSRVKDRPQIKYKWRRILQMSWHTVCGLILQATIRNPISLSLTAGMAWRYRRSTKRQAGFFPIGLCTEMHGGSYYFRHAFCAPHNIPQHVCSLAAHPSLQILAARNAAGPLWHRDPNPALNR